MSATALERLRSALADRYAIDRELGSGAMATVYLARDLKHHREVAVKVLRVDVAATLGAERFLREVEVLAHLHHPHILPLFDSGQADGCLYYVMPLAEGESLRSRLDRERQLPVDEALQITREIAGALDHAHRHQVIHRDIKPENVLLQEGQALVADFGIALAVNPADARRMTGTGFSIGTPSYMSPEQAAGDRHLDARSDVYSLAAVLYEMLAGEPPHTGHNTQAVIGKIITEPVRPVTAVRETVPWHVDAALRKALAKIPADRFSSAAAFARALSAPNGGAHVGAMSGRSYFRKRVAAAAAGLVGIAAGIAIGAWIWQRPPAPVPNGEAPALRRWMILLPDSAPLTFVGADALGVGRTSLAISPDGMHTAYVALRGATTQLYLRDLDRLDAIPLPGTAGASRPFFSPDGRWIGFFVGPEVRKVSLRGDQNVLLARVFDPYGAAWAEDGRILVSDRQGYRLSWVPGGGGTPQPIERKIVTRAFSPQIIADGEWILHGSIDGVLYLHHVESGWPYAIARRAVVRRDSADLDELLYGANPLYLESGHIAYVSNDGTLLAFPFDLSRRRVLGPPVPILEGVRLEAEAGDAQVAVSRAGTLVYAPGESARLSNFVWLDHVTGTMDTLPLPKAGYSGFDLSPDGREIAVRIRPRATRAEIAILDIPTGVQTRLATEGVPIGSPKWWPDGSNIIYFELFPHGDQTRSLTLRQSPRIPARRDTLPAGTIGVAANGRDLIQADSAGQWLVVGELEDRRLKLTESQSPYAPAFGPDGEWFAYMDEGAVFAANVGNPSERHKISLVSGEEPTWTPDGKRIIYRDHQEWWSVDVSTRGTLRAGRPRVLFRGPFLNVPGMSHDVSLDGRRQLLLIGAAEETTIRLVAVTNWFTEVEQLASP